jgi:hypothetical protein
MQYNFTLIAFDKVKIPLTSLLMFDEYMVGPWRTFIHLKSVGRLGSKTSNVAEPMKADLFPYARPKRGGSSPWTCPREDDGRAKGGWWVCLKRMWSFPCTCLGRMVIPLGMPKRGCGHSLGRALMKNGCFLRRAQGRIWSFSWVSQ